MTSLLSLSSFLHGVAQLARRVKHGDIRNQILRRFSRDGTRWKLRNSTRMRRLITHGARRFAFSAAVCIIALDEKVMHVLYRNKAQYSLDDILTRFGLLTRALL